MKLLKVALIACAILSIAFGYPANDEPVVIEKGMDLATDETSNLPVESENLDKNEKVFNTLKIQL